MTYQSSKIVFGTARRAFPGDATYIMNRSHTDEQGTEYPQGTEYVPGFAGFDNVRNTEIQTVSIGGAPVAFRAPQ